MSLPRNWKQQSVWMTGFEALTNEAWNLMPRRWREAVRQENIVFRVEKRPRQDFYKMGGALVLGEFRGRPVSNGTKGLLPNKIILYEEDIRFVNRYCTKRQLISHIRDILMHEIAHHFGWKDGDVEWWHKEKLKAWEESQKRMRSEMPRGVKFMERIINLLWKK